MKRFLALLLCLIMAVSTLALASCNGVKNPPETTGTTAPSGDNNPDSSLTEEEKLFRNAYEKIGALINYKLETEQTITSQGYTIKQVVLVKKDGRNEYIKTTNTEDASLNSEAWYVNEVYYGIVGGTGFKANIPYATYVEKYMPSDSTGKGVLMNIPESWFEDVTLCHEGTAYYLEFIVNGIEYAEYLGSMSISGFDSIDNISYKVYFTSTGELDKIATEFTMYQDDVEISVVATTKISDIDSTVITAPENADGFVDMTDSLA